MALSEQVKRQALNAVANIDSVRSIRLVAANDIDRPFETPKITPPTAGLEKGGLLFVWGERARCMCQGNGDIERNDGR
jgi:hypothetical protein